MVSLGGLTLGWWVYRGVVAGAPDPLEKPLGYVYRVFKYKYGIDELYQAVLYKPAIWLAEVFTYRIIDKRILDGIVEGIGKGVVWVGGVVRNQFDTPVINGAGDGLSKGVRRSGEAMRPVQSGRHFAGEDPLARHFTTTPVSIRKELALFWKRHSALPGLKKSGKVEPEALRQGRCA